jgi:hypothetical protein
MSVDPAALKDMIDANPALKALAASGDDAGVARMLNAPTATPGAKPGTWVTELGILDILGPEAGEAALQGLEAAAGGNPVIARVVRILKQASGIGNPGSGIDLGSPATRAMLAALRGTALAEASADALLAAGGRPYSLAELTWGAGAVVRADEVSAALAASRKGA